MDSHDAQQPRAEDSRAGIRNFVIFTFGLLLLVAWHVYDGFKHPEVRSAHFLRGGLLFLLGVLFWVHRLIREGLAFKARRGAHWTVAFYPALVVLLFLWAQREESRHLAAQKERDVKYQAWQQTVHRQSEITHQASEDFNAAGTRHAEAVKASIETSEKLKTADGKPAFRINPDAARKVDETQKQFDQAFARYRAETQRLLEVETQRPHQ